MAEEKNGASSRVLRRHAEQQFAEELAELKKADTRPRPEHWELSPWAVCTYLMGGTYDQICSAMSLLLSNIAGMLCDGAKESCALKVGSASSEAYCAMEWALEGQHLTVPQGVFGASIEETVANVGRVSREGMKTVDRVMIDILDERHRPNAEAF